MAYHKKTLVGIYGANENGHSFRSAVFVFRYDDDVFAGWMRLEKTLDHYKLVPLTAMNHKNFAKPYVSVAGNRLTDLSNI